MIPWIYADMGTIIDSYSDIPPTLKRKEKRMAEWISVDERLPELNENVLIYAVGKADGFIGDSVTAISCRFIFRLFPWIGEGVEEWKAPWQYFHSDYEITHWMPLPEPPTIIEAKGEDNGKS